MLAASPVSPVSPGDFVQTSLPFPLRAPRELLDAAAQARERDDPDRGAVGAEGWGFALANGVETRLVSQGGAKLANLGASIDPAWGLARALTLTGGWMPERGHVEELFGLSLYAVAPDGARMGVELYAGPSGLAIGDEPDRVSEPAIRALGGRLAAALRVALAKVRPTAVSLRVASDFGESKVASGQPEQGVSPFRLPVDASLWEPVAARGREASAADGLAAVEVLAPVLACLEAFSVDRKPRVHRAMVWLGPLWLRAFAYLEANLPRWEGDGADPMPAAVELSAPMLCCPPEALGDGIGREKLRETFRRVCALI
jgi:hypothetical protein